MKQLPKFLLVNGLGGVGKTTLYKALLLDPPKGWICFDFDHGLYDLVETGGNQEKRKEQHDWWIQVAKRHHAATGLHVAVFGVGVFPWFVPSLPHYGLLDKSQYAYGMLTCDEEVRRE